MLDESLLNTLKLGFSSAVQRIVIPSLDEKREFGFREPSVKEVNSISKIILSNSDSQSTVYASTLVFMKFLSTDTDFNPYEMNEIDRLKVLTMILSGIFFSKNLTVKCPKKGCGTSFPYSVKYGEIMKKIDEISTKKFIFENKTSAGELSATACFPKTKRYLDFLEFVDGIRNVPVNYADFDDSFVEIDNTVKDVPTVNRNSADSDFKDKIRKRREILKSGIKELVDEKKTILGNVDIKSVKKTEKKLDTHFLYVKNITVSKIPNSEDDFSINFDGLTYVEALKVLDVLPMRLFVKDDDSSFLNFIENELVKSMNSCSPEIKCPNCKHNVSRGLGIQNFFIHG